MFVVAEVAQPIPVSETLVLQTGIVVEKMNAVFRTNVRGTVAQNAVQIHTVLPRSTVVNIHTNTITTSADAAVSGRHATRVLTAEVRRNTVLRVKYAGKQGVPVRPTVIVEELANVVNFPNALQVVARNVLRILAAIRRGIAVSEVLSLMFVAKIVSGRHATRVLTAEIRRNTVLRVKYAGKQGVPVRPTVIVEELANVVNFPNALQVVARNVLRILTAIRRGIAVSEVLSLMFVAKIVSGRHAPMTMIVEDLTSSVIPILQNVRNLRPPCPLWLAGLYRWSS
jgi:hypothetical protein